MTFAGGSLGIVAVPATRASNGLGTRSQAIARSASRNWMRASGSVGGLALVVGAGFLAVAAYLHRTPACTLVAGVVIECPAAPASRAGLEAEPTAVDHRSGGDREQRPDGGVDACGRGDEFRAVALDADLDACPGGRAAHDGDRVVVRALAKTVIRGDLRQQLTRLKEQAGKTIIVNGSAKLVRSLLRDGLLDELRLFVHPLVVGSGQRLFADDSDQVELALVDSHTYDNGVVSLTYRPKGNSA
jgi:hypothetical protein